METEIQRSLCKNGRRVRIWKKEFERTKVIIRVVNHSPVRLWLGSIARYTVNQYRKESSSLLVAAITVWQQVELLITRICISRCLDYFIGRRHCCKALGGVNLLYTLQQSTATTKKNS